MKDYESEVGKLWLKKFKKSKAGDQFDLIEMMKETYPTKPAREIPMDLEKDPMERERKKEYRQLLKEKAKLLKERTA
jgi:hypothetical protein